MNRTLVRTCFVNRLHVFVCAEASKFDAFRVELLEQSMLVTGPNLDAAWREAMLVVTMMRAEYDKTGMRFQPSVFAPFAIITAVEHAREAAKLSVRHQMIVGGCHGEGHPVAAERVRSLIAALDATEFLKRPKAQALN
jgi:hypothetical protein